jgi:hypothetical protein
MPVTLGDESAHAVFYACREPGCLIRYDGSGYFIDSEDVKRLREEVRPGVTCPNDQRPMYLAEVMPERRSFRLWKCPVCNTSRTNEESSDELGRPAGA